MARRMAVTAARLSDEILPAVAVRQWVLSLLIESHYRLAYDSRLISAFFGAVSPRAPGLVSPAGSGASPGAVIAAARYPGFDRRAAQRAVVFFGAGFFSACGHAL